MEAAEVEPPKSLPPPRPEELVRALRSVIPIPVADRLFYVADAMRAGISNEEIHDLTKIDPWFLAQIDAHREGRRAHDPRRRRAGGAASVQATRLLRRPDRQAHRLVRRRRARAPQEGERRPGLCPRRHLRRRVRRAHAVPLFDVRDGERGEARLDRRRRSSSSAAVPNRIGQGIEFDYCCVHARAGAARARVRDRHGQLQPRDGVDRLRHLGSPVFRAAHARGRARDLRRRAAGGRDRAVRRADAAQARGAAREGRREAPRHDAPTRSIAPRTAAASTTSSRSSRCSARGAGSRRASTART